MKMSDYLLSQLESEPFFTAYWHEQDLLDSQEPLLPEGNDWFIPLGLSFTTTFNSEFPPF